MTNANDNQPKHAQSELKDLKFVNAEIYKYDCNIKGEPIANIDADGFSFGIIFPKKVNVDQSKEYAQRIVDAVNVNNELVEALKPFAEYAKEYLHKIEYSSLRPKTGDIHAVDFSGNGAKSITVEMLQKSIELLNKIENK